MICVKLLIIFPFLVELSFYIPFLLLLKCFYVWLGNLFLWIACAAALCPPSPTAKERLLFLNEKLIMTATARFLDPTERKENIMKKKIVIALGHRALGVTFPEQKVAVKSSSKVLAEMVAGGYRLIITHSNAPQMGMIHTAMNEFGKSHQNYTAAPMSVCSAMSQGYIGYDLQNALRAALLQKGIFKTVSTVLTQVLVDPYDDTFYHPVKVIGRYMTAAEAEEEEKKGNYMVEEPGKGFRRIVASPRPKDIIEIDAIRALSDAGHVVISCGGGGIPVLAQGSELKGASAIIEKDYTSGLLAEMTDADILMILTNDEKVCLDHLSEHPRPLAHLSIEEAEAHIRDNQFGETAMLPKIQASVDFIKAGTGRKAIITNLENALNALDGKAGTVIEA